MFPKPGDVRETRWHRWTRCGGLAGGGVQACETPGYSLPVADATVGGWVSSWRNLAKVSRLRLDPKHDIEVECLQSVPSIQEASVADTLRWLLDNSASR